MTLLEEIKKHGPSGKGSWYDRMSSGMEDWSKRDFFVKNYAWGAPDEESLKEIKEFVKGDKILEIGSGLGLWARLLQDIGVRITPTNPARKDDHYLNLEKGPFTKIHAMGHKEALETYGREYDVLMLCWPPYSEYMAYEALSGFNGDKLIYVGESDGGCNATDAFFTLLSNKWEEVKCIDIPQWFGLHDYLFMYERKREKVLGRLIQFD